MPKTRLLPWLLILGLAAFHAANNWLWLESNEVIPGWDRPAHLARSLAYYDTLTPLSWQGLFKASVQDPIRPPLFFASATPLYWAFGLSTDVAAMANVVYWLILLASVYGLGSHLGGWRLGVVGAVLAAGLPLLYAMSRSFYVEFSLAALVALTLYLLVASHGFERRGPALAFGVALGLGMLTKRTYPLFVAVPVAVVVLRSPVLRSLWDRLRNGLRVSFPDLMIALGAGIGLASLWVLPNRPQIEELDLGRWLFPAWAGLVTVTTYLLLRRPRDPGVNCLSALGLGASIASLWYLPRIEVIRRLLLYGYGVGDPRGRTLDLGSIYTYTYYPRHTTNEGLGLVVAALLALALVGLAVWVLKTRTPWRTIWRADSGWWVLILWPLAAYLLLTFSIYKEARAFAPALPGLALILAAGLLWMPWRWLRRALLALTVTWAALQFFVVSYAQFQEPARQTQFWSPVLGEAGLFARGVHLELSAAGDTDPGYNIQSNVLSRAESRLTVEYPDLPWGIGTLRAEGEADLPSARLGVLAQTPQINAGSFLYLTLTRYPTVEVAELARNYEGGDPLPRLYGFEYLLVKRENQDVDPFAQTAIDRILDDPPPLFQDAFVLETFYPLPDGDTAYLYRLRYWPDRSLSADYVAEAGRDLSAATRPDDALILLPPGLLNPLTRAGFGLADVHLLLAGSSLPSGDAPTARQALAQMSREHRRLFLLLDGGGGGELAAVVEEWLGRYTYRAEDRWFGNLRLALFGATDLPPAEQATQMYGVRFGDVVELTGTDLPRQRFQTGDVVPLTLFWQVLRPVQQDLKVFVHLLNTAGELVAQHDGLPASGYRPLQTWGEHELIVDRHGVLLPPQLPPGDYRLIVGLYDSTTGDRLPVQAGSHAADDHLAVGSISVDP